MEKAVIINNLTKKYKNEIAVNDISLEINSGEFFGFLGPNGAGKSTTMKILNTIMDYDNGEVKICNFDLRTQKKEIKKLIGYVSQKGGADLMATGEENLILGAHIYNIKKQDIKKRIDEVSEYFELKSILKKKVKYYSGGQRRRLEIALALIHKPKILMLDEPTTGLDIQNRANLWNIVKTLQSKGTTIILTTHYLEEAEFLCDNICIIDHGKIIAQGSKEELKQGLRNFITLISEENEFLKRSFKEFCDKVEIKDNSITFYTKNEIKLLEKIMIKVRKEKIKLKAIFVGQASLNDVFLKLTGRALRDIEE